MAKYILENAGDINWMATFALLTFVLMFVIGTFTILRRDAAFIDHMANMPLDENHPQTSETDGHEK